MEEVGLRHVFEGYATSWMLIRPLLVCALLQEDIQPIEAPLPSPWV